MNRVIITTNNCLECRRKKVKYEEMKLPLREIKADSEEGSKLVKQFNLMKAGVILDLDTGRVLEDD